MLGFEVQVFRRGVGFMQSRNPQKRTSGLGQFTWRGRGLSKSFISRVIIGVIPFRVPITPLVTYLLSPLPLQVGALRFWGLALRADNGLILVHLMLCYLFGNQTLNPKP